jgi:transposase
LRLLEAGDRSPSELGRELGVSAQTLRNWRRQARVDARPAGAAAASGPLASDERARLRQLERENRVLREEREILKKAAAWFATETTRPGGSR